MKKQIRKSYTLVEIMMVIVIAAILFGIGIPAFSTMIQGNSMTIAIRQLGAKISAARAYAVMNRCNVALLFLSSSTTTKDDYKDSAYRVCVVGDKEDSTYPFESWIDDEQWKTLPKGILQITIPTNTVKNVDASDVAGDSEINALIFDKKGQLSSGVTLNLIHGRYLNGTKINTDIQFDQNTNKNKVGTQPLTINQYTGKVSVGTFDYKE